MHLFYSAYKIFTHGVFVSFFPPFWVYSRLSGRYQESMPERLGNYPRRLLRRLNGAPRIWLHAVSVGEVSVAAALVPLLKHALPNAAILLSTTTEHGRASANRIFGGRVPCIYAPLDFSSAVNRALGAIQPDIVVFIETEIWPNWIAAARRLGIPTALVNGRISVRSIGGYTKLRPLMREVLQAVSVFSMIGAADAERICRLGAAPERVFVHGNAKYDQLLARADPTVKRKYHQIYGLAQQRPVWVAGSIRSPEEDIVLDAFERVRRDFPDALLILAPRHVQRAIHIRRRAVSRGLSSCLKTELDGLGRAAGIQVVILNTIGELQGTYSIADIAFCGGSIAPLGGQNVLEAAVWGVPVLYGPSMEDFADAKTLLEQTGGGGQVCSARELGDQVCRFLAQPEEARRVGARAKGAVILHRGAAHRHADAICRAMGMPHGKGH